MSPKILVALLAFATAELTPFDDVDDVEGLSLLQLRATAHQDPNQPDARPLEPYVNAEGQCCSADFAQNGDVIGPAEGYDKGGGNVIWWLRNELSTKEGNWAGTVRKLCLVNKDGRTVTFGYMKNMGSNSETPDPKWTSYDWWRRAPGVRYSIENIQCGECGAGDEGAAVGDPHLTTNSGQHFDYVPKAQLLQAVNKFEAEVLGLDNADDMLSEWLIPPCGCDCLDEFYDACCKRSGLPVNPGTQQCILPKEALSKNCLTRYREFTSKTCLASELPGDAAAAVGDPHLTTVSGKHFDYKVEPQ